jgi:hypothetical protein
MAKRFAVAVGIVLGLLALAVPAQAKGEGGVITIKNGGSGPGGLPGGGTSGDGGTATGSGSGVALLSSPIRITGRQSAFWFEETGFGQGKWDDPMHFGKVLSPTQLGPALAVTASFLCGPGNRHAVHQVLYPYAKGGPQTYTPRGQVMCGMNLDEGWYDAPYGQMFDTLVAHGLPQTLPAAFQHPATAAVGGSAATQPGPADRETWPFILAAVVALGGLILGNVLISRRRTRVVA